MITSRIAVLRNQSFYCWNFSTIGFDLYLVFVFVFVFGKKKIWKCKVRQTNKYSKSFSLSCVVWKQKRKEGNQGKQAGKKRRQELGRGWVFKCILKSISSIGRIGAWIIQRQQQLRSFHRCWCCCKLQHAEQSSSSSSSKKKNFFFPKLLSILAGNCSNRLPTAVEL